MKEGKENNRKTEKNKGKMKGKNEGKMEQKGREKWWKEPNKEEKENGARKKGVREKRIKWGMRGRKKGNGEGRKKSEDKKKDTWLIFYGICFGPQYSIGFRNKNSKRNLQDSMNISFPLPYSSALHLH